jgi:hypothetical protein
VIAGSTHGIHRHQQRAALLAEPRAVQQLLRLRSQCHRTAGVGLRPLPCSPLVRDLPLTRRTLLQGLTHAG